MRKKNEKKKVVEGKSQERWREERQREVKEGKEEG